MGSQLHGASVIQLSRNAFDEPERFQSLTARSSFRDRPVQQLRHLSLHPGPFASR
jgi:hypothetical protein